MDIEFLSRRQAITEWRDRQLFQIASILNAAGIEARAALDRQIEDAALFQSVWDPAGFVNARIDEVMQAQMATRIEPFLVQAAQELRAFDHRFASLAEALAASAAVLEMPRVSIADPPEPATPTDAPPRISEQGEGRLSRVGRLVGDLAVTRSARDWGSWAADGVASVANTMSRSLQDGTGLHQRLRQAGVDRIATAWMGDAGSPRPLKAQLVQLIEEFTNEARRQNL